MKTARRPRVAAAPPPVAGSREGRPADARAAARARAGSGWARCPPRKTPDATTGMVCGFCSTGCGLTIHLRDGEAVNLTPTTDYPVNRGMACPKGWEALTVLDAADRATVPLLRGDDGQPPAGRLARRR